MTTLTQRMQNHNLFGVSRTEPTQWMLGGGNREVETRPNQNMFGIPRPEFRERMLPQEPGVDRARQDNECNALLVEPEPHEPVYSKLFAPHLSPEWRRRLTPVNDYLWDDRDDPTPRTTRLQDRVTNPNRGPLNRRFDLLEERPENTRGDTEPDIFYTESPHHRSRGRQQQVTVP